MQGKLEAANQANQQKAQLIEQLRGESKRVSQEAQAKIEQMQGVIGKLRGTNTEMAGESERVVNRLNLEKREMAAQIE